MPAVDQHQAVWIVLTIGDGYDEDVRIVGTYYRHHGAYMDCRRRNEASIYHSYIVRKVKLP